MQSESIRVRDFEKGDRSALIALSITVGFGRPTTVAESRQNDEAWDRGRYQLTRRVAVDPVDRLVGWAELAHTPWQFHVRKYRIHIEVLPDRRQQGIGSRLLERLLVALRERDALLARTWRSRATSRRSASSPTAALARSGATFTPASAEEFGADLVEAPQALPQAAFLARRDGRLVGISTLERVSGAPELLEAGFTTVSADYRRRGVAFALKLHTIEWAREHGYRFIETNSNAGNERMLSINAALGFRARPARITLERRIGANAD